MEINVNPTNSYLCQACGTEFKSVTLLEYENGILPVCSSLCEFKKVYSLVSWMQFDDKTLKFYLKAIGFKPKKSKFNRNRAIFEISKFYKKIGLANIKLVVTGDKCQESVPKSVGMVTGDKPTHPYRKGCLAHSVTPTNSLAHTYDINNKKEAECKFQNNCKTQTLDLFY